MPNPEYLIPWLIGPADRHDPLPAEEWLLTNGLGGYAAGTLAGSPTRRYHGLLIAALHEGRFLLLNHVDERFRPQGAHDQPLGTEEATQDRSTRSDDGVSVLTEFRLVQGLPIWRYVFETTHLEKRLLMPYRQNTILIRYHLIEAKGPVTLLLRPHVHFRPHGDAVAPLSRDAPYQMRHDGDACEIRGPGAPTPLRLRLHGVAASLRHDETVTSCSYAQERARGYSAHGEHWSPGLLSVELQPGASATLIATAGGADALAIDPDAAFDAERRRRDDLLRRADDRLRADAESGQLVLAADQFLISTESGGGGGQGGGDTSIIAGYYWFTEWGRDSMISLDGLTLLTGRADEARGILRTFLGAARDGLVPNHFAEGGQSAVYYTADASLWLFCALDRYLEQTGDRALLDELLPRLRDIVAHYRNGTRFGIGVDPKDGLVRQSDPRYPLTWMDAKVGDWVVTPRRGKAVEINALWYNALKLLEDWLRGNGDEAGAGELAQEAGRVKHSFNARFWNAESRSLYDVVDGEQGNDALCRPNQIFALALRHPVLEKKHWASVFQTVRDRLLTPVGLRTLAPSETCYHAVYFGDRRSRDAAYHQGTVWPWLLGAYVDAWLRVHPEERRLAHEFLKQILRELGATCVGTLAEVHDAQAPYTARGCVAQAWSIAEVLRVWVKTADREDTFRRGS